VSLGFVTHSDPWWQDNLAADVRVETERRLKALEADLEAAELGKKERTLAVRYHKVKFFGADFFIFFGTSMLLTACRTTKSRAKAESSEEENLRVRYARLAVSAA
jgi:hypothetical protein